VGARSTPFDQVLKANSFQEKEELTDAVWKNFFKGKLAFMH